MSGLPGRYPGAIWIPSPHHWPGTFGEWRGGWKAVRPGTPRIAIVDHVMAGYISYLDSMARSANGLDGGRRVSSHLGIAANGEVHQYVDFQDWAWSNGLVDIETWPLRDQLGFRPGHVEPNGNLGTISVEHEGTGRAFKGMIPYGPNHPWPEPMVEASRKFHEWAFAEGLIAVAPALGSTLSDHRDLSTQKADDPGTEWRRSVRPGILRAAQRGWARHSEPEAGAGSPTETVAPAPAAALPEVKLTERVAALEKGMDQAQHRVETLETAYSQLYDALHELVDSLAEPIE